MSSNNNQSEILKMELILALRRAGVTNRAVVSTMESIPREIFVPKVFRDRSYEDITLPIGFHQTLSQPAIVGLMTEALELDDRKKVLEVGTGCGYQAAVLSRLCRRVYSIERYRSLLLTTDARLRELRINNVTTRWGDGIEGWPEQAPFDRMILTAAASKVPESLLGQMADDGIIIAPVGETSRDQTLMKLKHLPSGKWKSEPLWPVRFVPLLDGKISGTSNL